MMSFRFPPLLIKRLNEVAKAKGWSTTELVMTVLDQYLQSEDDPESN